MGKYWGGGRGREAKGKQKINDAYPEQFFNRTFRSDNSHPFHVQPVLVRVCELEPSFVDVERDQEGSIASDGVVT
jgi:hypothetical protein